MCYRLCRTPTRVVGDTSSIVRAIFNDYTPAHETLSAVLHHLHDQLGASPQRDGGCSGTDRTVSNEDDGHGDDGRHGDGLLQRYEKPFRARQTLQAGPGMQDGRHVASLDSQASNNRVQPRSAFLLQRFPTRTNPIRGMAPPSRLNPVPH